MDTLHSIIERAALLSDKKETGSITPEEVGGLVADLATYTQSLERDGATLGISKVYPTIDAMRADTTPVDSSGKPLRRGNLVAIYDEAISTTDTNSGLVCVWMNTGWIPVARIGTALHNENTAIEHRITLIESTIDGVLKSKDGELESKIAEQLSAIELVKEGITQTRNDIGTIIKEVKGSLEHANGRIDREASSRMDAIDGLRGAIRDAMSAESSARAKSEKDLEERLVKVAESSGRVKDIRLNGRHLPVSEEGVVDIDTVETDGALDPSSTNAVQNQAVTAAFKELDNKYPTKIVVKETGSDTDKAYAIALLNDGGEELSSTEYFSGGGGGSGSQLTTRLELTKTTDNLTLRRGDTCVLGYHYDHVQTGNGDSTGNVGRASVTITRGATRHTYDMTISAGSNGTLDVTKYLDLGTTSIRLRVEAGDEGATQVSSITWQIQVVQLTLSSSFSVATPITMGDTVSIPYTLSGSGNKTLRCYVDGVDREDRSIISSSASGAFSIATAGLAHGAHSVQLVAELEVQTGRTTKIIRSNSIYFDIAVRTPGVQTPIIATRFDNADGAIVSKGARPRLTARQYDQYQLVYAAYNPAETPTAVEVYEGERKLSDTRVPFTTTSLPLRSTRSGETSCRIVCGATIYTYTLAIDGSSLNLVEPTDGLELHLSAEGRSNNDTHRASWSYKQVTTELSGMSWGADGWHNGALRLTGSGRAVINHKPLASSSTSNEGFAFSVRLRATSVVNDNTPLISCLDDAGTGFVITPTEARLTTSSKSTLSMMIASGDVYEIGFVSFPKANTGATLYERTNSEMVYLYINGVMCGAVQRGVSDSIYQSLAKPITLGSSRATLEIFEMRIYNRALTDGEMLDLYIIGQDAERLASLYEENSILSSEGDIRVDSVPEGIRVMIITGSQSSGTPTVLHAATVNDKNARYDVVDILSFVKGGKPTQNLRIKGGCIRLQGTSSLAYPVKNYRIYTSDSKKQKAEVYVGCDTLGAGGKLAEGSLYSFREADGTQGASAPVGCWCLKADYAESSSAHNTGVARLAHYALVRAGDLTPAQRHVDKSRYPYDVRTTIDGEPCLLFYRATLSDEPIFLGKYNFNNDKSTEAVFGFRDIPGYHDAPWVKEIYGGKNPTECWEFLSNDTPMGIFKDDNFEGAAEDGTPNWLKTFEARFPDDDAINREYLTGSKTPEHLKKLVSWVKSTDTTAQGITPSVARERAEKFRNELAQYFDVRYLCSYYMLTEMLAAVDQRVKNMMFAFWHDPETKRMLCYPILYDNDTINGLRNDGRLKYGWDVDWTSVESELSTPENTVYAFAGHDSVLWYNLREQFAPELKAAYVRLRSVLSNDTLQRFFDRDQVDRYPERIYNIDALAKYVTPKTIGVELNRDGVTTTQRYSHLESMQGDRKSHRRWFLANRLGLLDAKYSTGLYTGTDITWKGNSAAGATVKATASRPFYFEFRREGSTMIQQGMQAGQEFSYKYDQVANIGTIFHLLGGQWMSKLNLSEWGGFTDLTLPMLPVLEELVMGAPDKTYTLSEFVIGANLPMMRKLDLRGYTHLPTLSLAGCPRIEEVDARGCSRLSTISFAESAPLTSLYMPTGYQNLSLVSLPNIERTGLHFGDVRALTGLRVENCPKLSGIALMREVLQTEGNNLRYIRINIGNYEDDGTLLRQLYELGIGGIDERGNLIPGTCKLIGNYQLTSYVDDALFTQYKARFDELSLRQPDYTVLEFDDAVADPANISNLDNKTGYKYGKPYEPSAHVKAILDARHGCLGKQVDKGTMKICRLHKGDFRFYADNANTNLATPAKLDFTEGDLWIYEPRYWYKGVNDIKNMKKYALYAYGRAPRKPEGKKILMEHIVRNLDSCTYMAGHSVSPNTTLATSLRPNSIYSVCIVPVDGYKRVRFPSVTEESFLGGVFLDKDDKVVGMHSVSSRNHTVFVSGMYWYEEVPSNAARFAFTILKDSGISEDFVWLTNSTRIEDIEPEWVEHKPTLVAGVKASVVGGRITSSSQVLGETEYVANKTLAEFENLASLRGLKVMTWAMRKDIVNLFMAKYGTRDSNSIFGDAEWVHYSDRKRARLGWCVDTGMNDTTAVGGYKKTLTLGTSSYTQSYSFRAAKEMGYENFEWAAREFVSGLSNVANVEAKGSLLRVSDSEGDRTIRLNTLGQFGNDYGAYIARVLHGRFMDILGVCNDDPERSNGFYRDQASLYRRGASAVVHTFGNVDTVTGGLGLFTLAQQGVNTSDDITTVRLAFDGKMEEIYVVDEYKKLLNNY